MFRYLSSNWKWGTVPVTKFSRRLVVSSITLTLIIAVLIIASLSPMIIHPSTAHADLNNTRTDAWGTLELAGSSWLGGGGVDVYSNGSQITYTPNKPNNTVNGIVSGEEWQCVELVNRLYLTKGWITSTWKGNGNELYANAPSNLTKQANGSITYLAVGDVLSMSNGSGFGHAAIVNSTSGSAITIVSQNTKSVYDSTSFTISNGTISTTWSNYSVIGVIHNPGRSTPAAISRSSTSMDLFYTDGRNLVNYGWNSTSGWSTTSWAEPGGTIGQPAVVARTSDTMDVFYTTGQHKLIHKGWWANTGWVYFDVLLSGDVAGDPTAIARDSGHIQVFYRTFEGEIKSIYWVYNSSGGTWNTNPQNLYQSGAATDPYAVTRSSDSMDVFFGNSSGNIVHLGWSSTYGWVTQSWATNSAVKNKPTAIVRNGGGDMSSYYQMNNGNVGEEAWDWQYGWSGQYWTAQLVGSPSAVAGVNHVIDNFYRETGGNIVDRYFTGTAWQSANIVGAGSATGNPFAITRGTTSEEVFYWNGLKLMDANWNTTSRTWSVSKIN